MNNKIIKNLIGITTFAILIYYIYQNLGFINLLKRLNIGDLLFLFLLIILRTIINGNQTKYLYNFSNINLKNLESINLFVKSNLANSISFLNITKGQHQQQLEPQTHDRRAWKRRHQTPRRKQLTDTQKTNNQQKHTISPWATGYGSHDEGYDASTCHSAYLEFRAFGTHVGCPPSSGAANVAWALSKSSWGT